MLELRELSDYDFIKKVHKIDTEEVKQYTCTIT